MVINKMSGTPVEILVVEDNPGDIRLIKEAFKDTDIPYKITVAQDGQAALEILDDRLENSAKMPNLITLDLNLPKMDGIELLKEIKKDEKLKVIPIIILTTSQKEEDIMETYRHNVNAYLTKPVELEEYTDIIHSIQNFWLDKVKLP